MANTNKNLNNFFNKNKFLGSFNSSIDIPYSEIKKECCFIGRSNVGKSSLINAITKTKKLAKISKTPGRTQSINVFEINNKINIIDLPGYGFAKVSKVMRENLITLIEEYTEDVEFNVTVPLLEKLPERLSDPVAAMTKAPLAFTVRPVIEMSVEISGSFVAS